MNNPLDGVIALLYFGAPFAIIAWAITIVSAPCIPSFVKGQVKTYTLIAAFAVFYTAVLLYVRSVS